MCFPILSTLEIMPYQQTCDLNGFMVGREFRYRYNKSQLKNETIYILYPNDPYNLSIWIYTVLLKFVPCLLLTLLSYKIISALFDARKRRMKLLNANSPLGDMKKKTNAIQLYKENQADRTTKMLLAVLILFLITEFPQAIMGLISALLGGAFLEECYAPLDVLCSDPDDSLDSDDDTDYDSDDEEFQEKSPILAGDVGISIAQDIVHAVSQGKK
ncbi:unnamed protein product [Ceutorhynchus assimilis]|uniref:G-protein coupled receptors family 1 profile domain-containing protein n=1 Tax=Ceutorhynchus assimilis TaxID=467358 RepID=A0A9N9MJ66_9CUCU|nr:unnamed protein product [Ceutorhynchus assimilis]